MQGLCVRCKKQVEIDDPKEVTVRGKGKRMNPAIKGKCSSCGTTVFRFIPRKA